jgi:hypothetical protein
MQIYDDYSSNAKQLIRASTISGGRRYKRILDLPAIFCRSPKFFVESGAAGPETEIVAVERRASQAARIDSKLKKLPFGKVTTFVGELHDCPHTGPYDLVNADTCSGLSLDLLKWIGSLEFLPGAELNLWVTPFRARGQFKQDLVATFRHSDYGMEKYAELDIRGIFPFGIDISVSCSVCAISCAMNRYNSIPIAPMLYTQHKNMMRVYRFTNINKANVSAPPIEKIISPGDYEYEASLSRGEGLIPEGLLFAEHALFAADNPAARGYIKGLFRTRLRDQKIGGKDPKWVKAGWKAHVSRIRKYDPELVQRAHRFIDAS